MKHLREYHNDYYFEVSDDFTMLITGGKSYPVSLSLSPEVPDSLANSVCIDGETYNFCLDDYGDKIKFI